MRSVKKIFPAIPTMEGAGVKLKRVFGYHQLPQLDPFLMLDDFRGENEDDFIKGFPWHPHRGIETITYMLYGTVEHGDSLGNKGVIGPGAVQWMTAGSGIIHQEMPKPDKEGRMGGFQLWANLPAKDKMCRPNYQEFSPDDIPFTEIDKGARARVISGTINEIEGPVRGIAINPVFADVVLEPDASCRFDITKTHKVFCYLYQYSGWFDSNRDPLKAPWSKNSVYKIPVDCEIGADNGILMGDGDAIECTAGKKGMRFLLIAGIPISEPIAWYGPIVMNTEEELELARQQLQNNTFLRNYDK